ncbi:dihydrolipoyl dehydrogenase [bacterium]|jgi:dihydrolipoamide dehydrogenase|nr:dihydrolipoyl dehydrogenase [bacterium]
MKPIETEVVVLGAGPGGYAAAFYAAEQGKKVILIEKEDLGGACLNRGCIPSKSLLYATKVMEEAAHSTIRGIYFEKPKINLDELRDWKNGIIKKLQSGIAHLAKQRNVEIIKGKAFFEDNETLRVETKDGQKFIKFGSAIVAVGSKPALPAAFDLGNKRIMTSTEALQIDDIPKDLLVLGGGYIGMELGSVYAGLGSDVTMVEALPSLLATADSDLVRPVIKMAKKQFKEIKLNTKVTKMASSGKKIKVSLLDDKGESSTQSFDKVLVSIGRASNSFDLGIDNTDINLDDKGFFIVDKNQRTSVANVYAIGDIAGGLLLAHKASKEAKIAVETIIGQPSTNENLNIPAVVFTHPEIAWTGLTETDAKEKGIKVDVSKFPWAASGRALSMDKTDGMTKLIIDPSSKRILGIGIVGENAGDLISEGVLAIDTECTVNDLALTIHPHPTLSETLMESAELYLGHSSHAISNKKK